MIALKNRRPPGTRSGLGDALAAVKPTEGEKREKREGNNARSRTHSSLFSFGENLLKK